MPEAIANLLDMVRWLDADLRPSGILLTSHSTVLTWISRSSFVDCEAGFTTHY